MSHGATIDPVRDVEPSAKNGAEVSQPKVSGRVEGQILRGSLQQKRKDEGPKDA